MVQGGRYGLEHPAAEAVWAAKELWCLFGENPECRADVARLYPKVIDLLDATESLMRQASSLQGAGFHWKRIESALKDHQEAPQLLEQLSLLAALTSSWNLLCAWAPFCLLYALSTAHPSQNLPKYGIARIFPNWLDLDLLTQPVFVSGLTNPNSGGYVGEVIFADDGLPTFIRTDSGPAMSFFNLGPEELTIPRGVSPVETNQLVQARDQEYEAIREKFRGWGMVDPKGWQKLDEAIFWLFLRLKTGDSWARVTNLINKLDVDKGISPVTPRQSNNVSKRVRELQRILLIESRPEAQIHTAKFKESHLWDKNP